MLDKNNRHYTGRRIYFFDHILLFTSWNGLELEFGYLFLDDRMVALHERVIVL